MYFSFSLQFWATFCCSHVERSSNFNDFLVEKIHPLPRKVSLFLGKNFCPLFYRLSVFSLFLSLFSLPHCVQSNHHRMWPPVHHAKYLMKMASFKFPQVPPGRCQNLWGMGLGQREFRETAPFSELSIKFKSFSSYVLPISLISYDPEHRFKCSRKPSFTRTPRFLWELLLVKSKARLGEGWKETGLSQEDRGLGSPSKDGRGPTYCPRRE